MRATRLTTLVETVLAGQGKGLVALMLCPILLAGCAGAGLQSSGLAGPSWQQREALHLQEEENGDLGDRLEEAEKGARKDRREGNRRLLWLALGVALVFVLADASGDEDDDPSLAFDPWSATESQTADSPPRRQWRLR